MPGHLPGPDWPPIAMVWYAGFLAGTLINTSLVLSAILVPRLREHGGTAEPVRWLEAKHPVVTSWIAAIILIVAFVLWGQDAASAFIIRASAATAAAILPAALIMIATAATQVARRSVP